MGGREIGGGKEKGTAHRRLLEHWSQHFVVTCTNHNIGIL